MDDLDDDDDDDDDFRGFCDHDDAFFFDRGFVLGRPMLSVFPGIFHTSRGRTPIGRLK